MQKRIIILSTNMNLFVQALGRMPGDSCDSIGEEEEEEGEDSNENEETSAEDDQSPEGRVIFLSYCSFVTALLLLLFCYCSFATALLLLLFCRG